MLLISIMAYSISKEEVEGIILKHSSFNEVKILNQGRNIIIDLKLNVKATENSKVAEFVINDSKNIFSYFKKKYTAKDYDVVDINFYIQNLKVANSNAWSETIDAMNIKSLNFNNAKNKLDSWYYNWD